MKKYYITHENRQNDFTMTAERDNKTKSYIITEHNNLLTYIIPCDNRTAKQAVLYILQEHYNGWKNIQLLE